MLQLGDFQLVERIAHGGMADVWRAVHEPTETVVAVKLPVSHDPRFARAIHAEASAMATLRSSRVVRIHDLGVVTATQERDSGGKVRDGTPWMAMEWVGGGTAWDGVDGWPELHGLLLDVLRALSHAHARGIVHRDVKPGNVLIESRRPLRVKLADFGIAFARQAYLETSGAGPPTALTPMFAAPEQLGSHAATQGPWTDLYQLGGLAWTLVSGQPPFPASGLRAAALANRRRPLPAFRATFAVPDAFEGWVRRLLAKRPADRFACAADAAKALRELDPEAALRPRAPGSVAPPARIVGPALATLRSPRLVGRDRDREHLRGLMGQLPRVVLVRGPSGVGTSAVVRAVGQGAEERGDAVAVRGRDDGQGLAGLCAHALGISLAAKEALQPHVEAALQTRLAPGPSAQALLALLERRLEDRAERFEVAAATLAWRADRPLILEIDPPHDRGDLVPFARWLAETRRLPVLTLIAASDERLADHPKVRSAADEELVLAPLGPADTLTLIEDLGLVDTVAASRIAERSAGQPANAVHLVREQLLHDLGEPSGAGSSQATDPERWEARHLELLTTHPAVGSALEVAAALGHTVDHDEWVAVCASLGRPLTLATVATLTRQLVLTPDGPTRYRFLQPAFRESVLRHLGAGALRLHRCCAEVLAERGAPADRIGAHRQDAGEVDAAFPLLVQGAREAGFQGDLVRAQVALDRATRGLPDGDPRLAEVLFNRIERARTAGAPDEALHHVRHLLRLARSSGSEPAMRSALLQRSALRVDEGDLAGLDDAVAALAQSRSDLDRSQAMVWLGMELGVAGRTDEAEERLTEAVRINPVDYVGRYGLGCVQLDRGSPAEAMASFDQALAVVANRDDRLNETLMIAMRSNALRGLGRLAEAEAEAVRAEGRLVELHSGFAFDARVSLGLTRLAAGRPDAAQVPFARLLVEAERPRRMGVVGLAVATARAGNDDPTRWLEAFEPGGLWMSRALDREAADLLHRLAGELADPRLATLAGDAARILRARLAEPGPDP